jgi:hypothetical protein
MTEDSMVFPFWTDSVRLKVDLGLYWDDCWDELKGLFGAERWVKRRLISVKQLCYTPSCELRTAAENGELGAAGPNA